MTDTLIFILIVLGGLAVFVAWVHWTDRDRDFKPTEPADPSTWPDGGHW